jgi:hypothetical protein
MNYHTSQTRGTKFERAALYTVSASEVPAQRAALQIRGKTGGSHTKT